LRFVCIDEFGHCDALAGCRTAGERLFYASRSRVNET